MQHLLLSYARPAPLFRNSVEEMSLLKSCSGMLSKRPCDQPQNLNARHQVPCYLHRLPAPASTAAVKGAKACHPCHVSITNLLLVWTHWGHPEATHTAACQMLGVPE